MEGIQAHWIPNVQKSLTPILQHKNLWVCLSCERVSKYNLSLPEWWTKSRGDPGELCTQKNNCLPKRFVYFMPGFLWQCRLPAYVLLVQILLKTGESRARPSCKALLLPSPRDSCNSQSWDAMPGTWTRSTKVMGLLLTAPKSIASLSATMREPDTSSSFSLNKNKGI